MIRPMKKPDHVSELPEKMADYVVRRLLDMRGSTIIYSGQKKQAEIGMPEAYGLSGFEERYISGGDGGRIGLWYKPPTDPDKPVYVAFHGRTGHWGFAGNYPPPKHLDEPFKDNTYRSKWLKAMADSGAGVVAVHTRGFGRSHNSSVKKITSALIAEDMRAIDHFLEAENICPRQTVLVGESLGGALASLLSDEMAQRGRQPAMLALINTFSDMSRMVHQGVKDIVWKNTHYLKNASEGNIRRHMKDPLNTAAHLSLMSRDTKLYIAQAPFDDTIDASHAKRLLESARQVPLDVTFRALVGEYKTHYPRNHTNWNPTALVADLERVYHDRGVVKSVGLGR